jgi:putative endonuclease
MAYLYVLHSEEIDSYYIGSTRGSLPERLRKHLSNHKGYTAKAKDWKVVYEEYYPDYLLANAREKYLKSLKDRNMVEQLIQSK